MQNTNGSEYENSYKSSLIELAQSLVRIPSENPPADYGAISTYIKEVLDRTGAEVVFMEGQNGKPNVAAFLRGEDPNGLTLLLDGHMDVVPAGDRSMWEVDPYAAERRNGEIWGRGSVDMKGSLASQIQAFINIATLKQKLRGNLIFVATCDDETAGKMGMGYVFPSGFDSHGWPYPTFHLLGEANQLNITTAFKGRIWIEVKALGKRAHGGAPMNGINAIEPVALIGQDFSSLMNGEHPLLGHDTYNFGMISGGEQVNVVPDLCTARFDMRFGPHMTTKDLEDSVVKVIEKRSGGTKISYDIFERREPINVDPNLPVIELLGDCIATVTGRTPEIQGTLSAGDLIYTGSKGIPGVWVGPGDPAYFHVVNERISEKDLIQATHIYTLFARRYLGESQ